MNAMFRSGLFVILLFLTSLFGSIFILFPLLPLLLISPKTFRFFGDEIVAFWECLPVSMMEIFFGLRCLVVGDRIQRNRRALIIMNHRTRLDWLFFWSALYRIDPFLLTSEKIILKGPLKKIPGAGWAMECNAFLFLNRKWDVDQVVLADSLSYFASTGNQYQVLLFPEGTDFCENTKRISDQFAQKSALEKYEYVLHPRSTGFVHIVKCMQETGTLDCIYDVTLGYADDIVQSEVEFVKGRWPKTLIFHVKRYDIVQLPTEEKELESWLSKRWRAKELLLSEFYQGSKRQFPGYPVQELDEILPMPRKAFLWFSFVFWVATLGLWGWFLYLVWWFWMLYVIFAILAFVLIRKYYGGVERLEIERWKRRK